MLKIYTLMNDEVDCIGKPVNTPVELVNRLEANGAELRAIEQAYPAFVPKCPVGSHSMDRTFYFYGDIAKTIYANLFFKGK